MFTRLATVQIMDIRVRANERLTAYEADKAIINYMEKREKEDIKKDLMYK